MGFLHQDARFAARIFLRTPAITGSIILLLALGIGANSAMFSVVDGLLLHPVRYLDPDKLVFIWSRSAHGDAGRLSGGDFLDLRAQARSLQGVAAWVPGSFVVLGGDRPEQLEWGEGDGEFFPHAGREAGSGADVSAG